MDPLSTIAGVAVAAGLYALYLAGRAGLPKLVSAGGWVKGKLTASRAVIEQLDGDVGHLFQRIAVLEAKVEALAKAGGTGEGGQAVAEAVKAAAENVAPAFLQPKPDAAPQPQA